MYWLSGEIAMLVASGSNWGLRIWATSFGFVSSWIGFSCSIPKWWINSSAGRLKTLTVPSSSTLKTCLSSFEIAKAIDEF